MSNIFVGSFYRSGSNHISGSLANLLGCNRTYLHSSGEGYAQDPQRLDLNIANIMFGRFDGMVYLGHLMGTKYNVGILKAFGPSVIVTMRKLIPCLHSLRRYEDALVADGLKDDKYFNAEWPTYTNKQKWGWVAYNIIPWYYQCYVTWMKADIPHMTVWFERHFADQIASVRDMLKFLGVDGVPQEHIEKCFLHKDINYTKTRTIHEVPQFVSDEAYKQAECWGQEWGDRIVRDLL